MDTVVAILFEVAILVYAGINLGRARSTIHRIRAALRARARGEKVRVPDMESRQATIACIWTMRTLIVLSTVTILYLVIGKTPVEFINDLGAHLPLSANRKMLLIATGMQALLKLYMTDKYERSVDCHYFPSDDGSDERECGEDERAVDRERREEAARQAALAALEEHDRRVRERRQPTRSES